MLQPPTSSSVSDTNFHTNLFGKCVHLMPSPVTVRKRNRMWNEATSVRTRWGFQKHLSKKVASWSGWMSPNGQPWRMILLEAIILQFLFHTFSHSLAIQTLQDSLISFCQYGFVSAFEILHKYTSLGGQPLCCEFWQPACYSRLRRHSRHEGFNNGVLLAYSFASNETQPTLWTVNRSSLLPVRKLKAKRAAMFTLQN